jgi:hypothetical protein
LATVFALWIDHVNNFFYMKSWFAANERHIHNVGVISINILLGESSDSIYHGNDPRWKTAAA